MTLLTPREAAIHVVASSGQHIELEHPTQLILSNLQEYIDYVLTRIKLPTKEREVLIMAGNMDSSIGLEQFLVRITQHVIRYSDPDHKEAKKLLYTLIRRIALHEPGLRLNLDTSEQKSPSKQYGTA